MKNINFSLALIIGLTIELIIAIACISGYFFYYVKLPEYSLNEAKEAFYAGNVGEFERYVDVDALVKDSLKEAERLIPRNQTDLRNMIKSGQMATVLKMEIEERIKTGQWGKTEGVKNPLIQDFLQDAGLMTFSYHGVAYLHQGTDPLLTAVGEEVVVHDNRTKIDKILDFVEELLGYGNDIAEVAQKVENTVQDPSSLQKEFGKQEEDPEANGNAPVAEAGLILYDDVIGDTVIVRLKLQQNSDGKWRAVDLRGYGEVVRRIAKNNRREMKVYTNKVYDALMQGEEELEAFNAQNPVENKDWAIGARDIMKKNGEQLESITVPRSGKELSNLLVERRNIGVDLMNLYYERAERKKKNQRIENQLTDLLTKYADNRKQIDEIVSAYKDLDLE